MNFVATRRSIMTRCLLALLTVAVTSCLTATCLAAGVSREEYIPVKDARLYMLVRGDNADAPVLIWLHGGPGGAERPLFRLFNSPLERRFVVAYLDQRGTGRSYHRDADPKLLTIARHLSDLDTVVDHLRSEFGKQKVILVGHSWGSALGLLYAQAHRLAKGNEQRTPHARPAQTRACRSSACDIHAGAL